MDTDFEFRLGEFLGKYEPDVQARFRLARRKLRKLIPRGHELAYDNYNALVLGYSPSERASQAIVSIAAYPRWVNLYFLKGAKLADPARRLSGTGSTVRSIRLVDKTTLDEPDVQDLLQRALEPDAARFAVAPKLQSAVRSVAARQRSRKPGGQQ